MSTSALPDPPFNLEVERSVIGSLLRDPNNLIDALAVVSAEDFYSPRHRGIYAIMAEIENVTPGQCDVVAVSHEIERRNKLEELGGKDYLGECMMGVPSAAYLDSHLTILRDLAIRRSLLGACERIQKDVHDHESGHVENLVEQAERQIFDVGERLVGQETITLSDLVDESLDRIISGKIGDEGLKTGYLDLDEKSGFRPGDFVVLAARPGMGKTAFALNLLQRVAEDNTTGVLMFSLEMPREQLIMRMLSTLSRVSHDSIRRNRLQPADLPRLTSAAAKLRETTIYVDDSSQPSLAQIRAKARRLKREGKLNLIIVDYLQLLQAKAESRQNEISLISRTLKSIARDLGLPVLALAQLNRKAEERTDHKPMLSDLRESGAIEQDADMVMLLMREDYYEETEENRDQALMIIAKNRHGATGEIRLKFNKRYMGFENYDPHSDQSAVVAGSSQTAFD
jgi:replicative DNA helicase